MNASSIASAIGLSTLLLTGCCCFAPEPVEPRTLPIVREATIAVFNSSYVGNAPTSEFNLASFKFPSNDRSSGALPNDDRFALGSWAFSEPNYPAQGLTSFYEFFTPPNALIAGDMIVDDINIGAGTATIRVRGKLLRLPPKAALLTDDASVFAREIATFNDTASAPANRSVCADLEDRSTLYGSTQDNPALRAFTIRVEEGGQNSPISYPDNWPRDSRGNLLPPIRKPLTTDLGYYPVTVRQGDWFYYRAVNNMSFFVLVTAVQQGTLPPFIRRLTLKFSESYGCYNCSE